MRTQTDLGEEAFRQALRDLETDLRLMCVAAHPDDEDGATLALYRKQYGYKTFAVIGTRGEGGQNEIGPELYEDLGVIRTREMMAASEITGAELCFLNLPEFGYSKSPEETLQKWGREETVRRLVRVIRETRPDVIITHHGRAKDHGHHQALGAALIDAFDQAANPSAFPKQGDQGLAPWQPARLYIRSWEPTPDSVTIDLSALDPWQGETYAEMAARALEAHASQGMGFFIQRYLTGRPKAHYTLVRSVDGGVSGAGNVSAPGGVLFEGLMDRVSADMRSLVDQLNSREKLKATLMSEGSGTAQAAALAAEIRLSVAVDDDEVVPGQELTVKATLIDYGARDAAHVAFAVEAGADFPIAPRQPIQASLSDSQDATAEFALTIPEDLPPTIPHAEHLYDDGFLQPQFAVVARVACADGQPDFELHVPVRVEIAPPVSVEFVGAPYLARINVDETVPFHALLTSHAPGPVKGSLSISASAGLNIETHNTHVIPFALEREGQQVALPVTAYAMKGVGPRPFVFSATVSGVDRVFLAEGRFAEVNVPQQARVGVVQSYNDIFVNTLERLHVPHETIDIDEFVPEILDEFTTILIDIRAYLVRRDLVANNQTILDYVERGGAVIVMYQKTFEWREEFAPYPIRLSRNRVTVEEAPVELLVPGHPLFNTPNTIEPSDWDGWIQERGLYFPDRWDERYTPLIACSDPDEEIPPGVCLIASHGKGAYVYTPLVWYRQLRELHPGALKVFANMLALGLSEVRDPENHVAQ